MQLVSWILGVFNSYAANLATNSEMYEDLEKSQFSDGGVDVMSHTAFWEGNDGYEPLPSIRQLQKLLGILRKMTSCISSRILLNRMWRKNQIPTTKKTKTANSESWALH